MAEATPTESIEQLESILRCPETQEPLRREGDAFVAPGGQRYPIVRGIPRFVSDDHYVGSFSFEWNTHDQTQIDSRNPLATSEQFFREKTGLTPEDVKGKLVLDAGVGAGRFSTVLASWGARVVGVDLSYAVEAAKQNLAHHEETLIAQADIFKLPFAPETFDFAISIGVLHHTPDAHQAFRSIAPLLRRGGSLCVWLYPHEGDYKIRNHWIPYTRHIPVHAFYRFCRRLVTFADRHPHNPLVDYVRSAFPFSNQGLGLENDILDTFDGYSPYYHSTHTPEELRGWFAAEGYEDVHSQPAWPTAVRGRRA